MKARYVEIARPRSPVLIEQIRRIPGVRIGRGRWTKVPANAFRSVYAQFRAIGEVLGPRGGTPKLIQKMSTLFAPPKDPGPDFFKNLRSGTAEWLTEFQREGIKYALDRVDWGGSLFLHAPGAGKTASYIALCQQIHQSGVVVAITKAGNRRFFRSEGIVKEAGRRLQSVRTACSTQAGSYPPRGRREHHADGVRPSCGTGHRCSPLLAG